MTFSSQELQKFQRTQNVKIVYSCLFILYMYRKVFDQIKQNNKMKSLTTINRVYSNAIKETLASLGLIKYLDILCVVKVIDGRLEITASLLNINASEYSNFFLEVFNRLKNFITQNNYSIELSVNEGYYFLQKDGVEIKQDDEYLLSVALNVENKVQKEYGKDFLI